MTLILRFSRKMCADFQMQVLGLCSGYHNIFTSCATWYCANSYVDCSRYCRVDCQFTQCQQVSLAALVAIPLVPVSQERPGVSLCD